MDTNRQPRPEVVSKTITSTDKDTTSTTPASVAQDETPQQAPVATNLYATSLRGLTLKALIAALIIAALVTVVLILVGKWNETTYRAIWTMVIALIHLLIVLGLASVSTKTGSERAVRSSNALLNLSLVIVSASFFLATLAIWQFISGTMLLKWYGCFVIILVAAIHTKFLYDYEYDTTTTARRLTISNYVVLWLTAAIISVWLLVPDLSRLTDGFYGRLVAATIVADVTIGIIVAVMRHMAAQKLPANSPARQKSSSSTVVIIISLIIIFVLYGLPLISGLLFHTY